jgi:hypothetical protein
MAYDGFDIILQEGSSNNWIKKQKQTLTILRPIKIKMYILKVSVQDAFLINKIK